MQFNKRFWRCFYSKALCNVFFLNQCRSIFNHNVRSRKLSLLWTGTDLAVTTLPILRLSFMNHINRMYLSLYFNKNVWFIIRDGSLKYFFRAHSKNYWFMTIWNIWYVRFGLVNFFEVIKEYQGSHKGHPHKNPRSLSRPKLELWPKNCEKSPF